MSGVVIVGIVTRYALFKTISFFKNHLTKISKTRKKTAKAFLFEN